MQVYNESLATDILPTSMRTSVMSLIHKKGEVNNIENYRPISLSDTDYKILTFILANRLKTVIGTIIEHDQTAYIPVRYIGDNIRLIDDFIRYFDDSNKGGILLSIDFKKAFDSIEWNFLCKSLKHFGFGKGYINWIKTIYKQSTSCIKNNGYISETFHTSRGVRQ